MLRGGWRVIYHLSVLVYACFCFLLMVVQAVRAQELPAEFVSLTGRDVPQLLGVPLTEIAALAIHNESLTPVHLQIDQRVRADGGTWRYTFEAGEERSAPATAGLGSDDVLLFMVSEGGERAQLVPNDHIEIEVTQDSGQYWFYLRRGPSPELAPLISYDAASDRIATDDYAIDFGHSGTAVMNALLLADREDRSNILDRNKARLDIDLALGIGRVSRTENDVQVHTTGLHAGPLRIIRESEVRGRMLLGMYSAAVRDNFIFYPHGFVLPTTVRLTPTARMLVRNVTLRISMDLTNALHDMTFQSAPEMPTPVAIDGRGGLHGGHRPIEWYLLRRNNVGLLGWLRARDDIAREVSLYYRDDRGHDDPPEKEPGEFGDHGFLFHHEGPLPAGEVRLSTHAWILRGEQLANPAAQLRTLMSPPVVRVH